MSRKDDPGEQAAKQGSGAGLSAARRALLERRLRGALASRDDAAPATASIPRRRDRRWAPLSPAQERLWFLERLVPGTPLYNVSRALTLEGRLQRGALAAALHGLVARHEALRTRFVETAEPASSGRDAGGGPAEAGPVQEIAAAVAVPLPAVDLAALPAARRAAESRRLAEGEARRAFDVTRAPLLRALLLAAGAQRHVLVLTVHHLVFDGWSLGVLLRDLSRLYAAALAAAEAEPGVGNAVPGVSNAVPALAGPQFADFAAWQRERLAGGGEEAARDAAQLDAWRRRLAGLEPVELPTDRPRGAERSLRAGHLPLTVEAPLAEALRRLARERGASLFMVLLAGWQALLARYTGSRRVAVGSPVANRGAAETEGMIGFFVNTLALDVDLSGDPTAAALVERTRDGVLDALAHQEVPFSRVVEALAPQRSLSHSPLFQTSLALQNAPAGDLELPGLRLAGLDIVHRGATDQDLNLSLEETADGGLGGVILYDAALFDAATVERMVAHWRRLLAAMAARPETRLSQIDLLGDAERRDLLVARNDTASAYPRDGSLAAAFLAAAAEHADEVAVEAVAAGPAAPDAASPGPALTYRQLAERAGRLARVLAVYGVGPEVRVGLFLDRSPEAVVALVAVTLAGGAYVPLDPTYPRERLTYLLRDAELQVLVTRSALAPELEGALAAAGVGGQPVLRVDALPGAIPKLPLRRAATDGLAYVMYTSGSTGEPKGVAVTQRGVLRLAADPDYLRLGGGAADGAGVGSRETALQVAPLAFDASTGEIWCSLLHGWRLVLAPPGVVDPAELGAVIAGRGVTRLWLTAGLFHRMVDDQLAALAGVRQILAGGDVVSAPHVDRVLRELPGTRMTACYGPTENTLFTTTCQLAGPADLPDTVPLGTPISDTRVYVLDRSLLPVPAGVVGELYAAGDGLARGYLDRPGRTAQSFLPDPFATGERMYRTGDLARWRSDGRLEFAGRYDSQVKVRGYRIEPGEVEAVLASHPGVASAVVLALGDGAAEKRLVGCVARRDEAPGAAVAAADLDEWLRERLPEYMVPGAFVVLDAMPRTANDKVDRRELTRLAAEAAGEAAAAGAAAAPPRTPMEELVAGLFASLLDVSEVGRGADFFRLGGHSLLATRLVARLRDAVGVELPLRRVFEAPAVAALAAVLEDARRQAQERPARPEPPLVALPRPAGPGGARVLRAADLLRAAAPVVPRPARPRPADLQHARRGGARRRPVGGRPGRRPGRPRGAPRDAAHRLSGRRRRAAGAGAAAVAAAAAGRRPRRPAGAGRRARGAARRPRRGPPPLRPRGRPAGPLPPAAPGAGLRCPAAHRLLVTLHHVISDGWSTGVLLAELAELYAARVEARPAALPALPVQYADYAAWQRSWLDGEVLAAQLDHWRHHLAGVPVLELPTDRPRPAVAGQRGRRLRLALDAGLGGAVRRFGRRRGATPFMTLLAAFATLLGRTAGQRDLAVGTPVAGRRRVELEGLIGFFVNTLALRTPLAGDGEGEAGFAALVDRLRDATLDAYAHQDVPFERLVEELAPSRDLARSPLFQAMFILQNAFESGAAHRLAGGVEMALAPVEATTSKFELTLSLEESDDGGFGGWWVYRTDLFDAATAQRMARHFRVLLAAALAAPEVPLSRLPLLTAGELQQVLGEWNAPRVDYPDPPPPAGLLADLFAAQVARRPGAVALELDGETLTYGELAHRSPGAGAAAAPARRRGRGAGGHRRRARLRPGGRPARHPAGRRRLRAARPGAAGRAAGLPRRRRRPALRARPVGAGGTPRRPHRRRRRRVPPRCRCSPSTSWCGRRPARTPGTPGTAARAPPRCRRRRPRPPPTSSTPAAPPAPPRASPSTTAPSATGCATPPPPTSPPATPSCTRPPSPSTSRCWRSSGRWWPVAGW